MRIEPREPFMDLSIIYANWNSMDYLCRCVVRIYEHTGGNLFRNHRCRQCVSCHAKNHFMDCVTSKGDEMSSITNRGVREPSSETSSGTTPVKVDSAKAASPPPQQRTRGKKIWIDLENSPHVPFFKPIIEELEERGHSVLLTARDCFQVYDLADLLGLQYKRIGRHYGKHMLAKVAGLGVRVLQLSPTVLKHKPDLAGRTVPGRCSCSLLCCGFPRSRSAIMNTRDGRSL